MIDIVSLYAELSTLSDAEQRVKLAELKKLDANKVVELEKMLRVDDITVSTSQFLSEQISSGPHLTWQSFIAQEVMSFSIKKLLSDAGGMGLVFHAEQSISSPTKRENEIHKAAIKVLRSDKLNTEQQKEMFFTEASNLMSLDHPNICSIYGVSEVLGHACIVMDYIDGQSLDTWFAANQSNHKEKINLFNQLLNAVCYLHDLQIYHGDLKPQNIIINNQGHLILIDLGLARKIKGNEVNNKTVKAFSKNWSAPEQVSGIACEITSDVYSLAAIMTYLLTGSPPKKTDSQQINNKELCAVLNKALSAKPDNRYQDAHQLRFVLQKYQTGFPIDEYSISPLYRFKKLIFRKPFTSLACLFMLYSLISSLMLFIKP